MQVPCVLLLAIDCVTELTADSASDDDATKVGTKL